MSFPLLIMSFIYNVPMQEFSSHDNVIQLINVIKARNDIDIYLVFEFMDTDLHAVVKAKILKPVHIQYIMYQVCEINLDYSAKTLGHIHLVGINTR